MLTLPKLGFAVKEEVKFYFSTFTSDIQDLLPCMPPYSIFWSIGLFDSRLLWFRINKVRRPCPWEFIVWGRMSAFFSRHWLKIWPNALKTLWNLVMFEFYRLRSNFPALLNNNKRNNAGRTWLPGLHQRPPASLGKSLAGKIDRVSRVFKGFKGQAVQIGLVVTPVHHHVTLKVRPA